MTSFLGAKFERTWLNIYCHCLACVPNALTHIITNANKIICQWKMHVSKYKTRSGIYLHWVMLKADWLVDGGVGMMSKHIVLPSQQGHSLLQVSLNLSQETITTLSICHETKSPSCQYVMSNDRLSINLSQQTQSPPCQHVMSNNHHSINLSWQTLTILSICHDTYHPNNLSCYSPLC